jgi:guanylate kinase
MPRGQIFVLSAPSGAGKSTVGAQVRKRLPDLAYSVSLTTRSPRPGEQDGVDYFFVSREEFERRLARSEIAEHAEIYGNLYGTSAKALAESLDQGKDLLLEIDVEGAAQLRRHFPKGVFIFLMPPSMQELERRLRARGTEDEGVIYQRLARAQSEMDRAGEYTYQVINDDLEQAVTQVVEIISRHRGTA